eukprot:TRINITY_DN6237_c0_g1_i1.p1 TRINITY_DN6237_c0_g1~~TRINITY_DN6237_c0_g1_i1.p1  ORF type:complete len:257 (+),score=-2.28 TRINITY_DN6237_c0_g1_i1:69-839(+)
MSRSGFCCGLFQSVDERETELFRAAEAGDSDAVSRLVQAGVNVNARRPQSRETVAHVCALVGDVAMLHSIVALGANIHLTDTEGRTAIFVASMAGHLPVVEALVQYGASPHILNRKQQSPLFGAAWRGRLPVVQYLVEQHRADPTLRDEENRSAVEIAREWNHQPVAQYLQNYMASQGIANAPAPHLAISRTYRVLAAIALALGGWHAFRMMFSLYRRISTRIFSDAGAIRDRFSTSKLMRHCWMIRMYRWLIGTH